MNGEKIEGATSISSTDVIHLRTSDELTRAQLSITVREQGALALLTVTPGTKITRTVKDTLYVQQLTVETEETHETVNDLSQQMIRQACEQLGIRAALDKRVLWEACETTQPYEAIVARGIFPKPGLDGDIEVQLDVDGFVYAGEDKVDFRERASMQLVQEGQLVATVLPPISGQSGTDVFGQTIDAEDGQPVTIQIGKSITQTGNHLFAAHSGKLVVERTNHMIYIDVSNILELDEVSLASGNIRFDGDVVVAGSVSQGCLIEATGAIEIRDEVIKGEVRAGKSIQTEGHISSSTIEVGPELTSDTLYAIQLEPLLPTFRQLCTLLETVQELRSSPLTELEGYEVKKILRVILGDRYEDLQEKVKAFSLIDHSNVIDPEWKNLQLTLYSIFVNTMSSGIDSGTEFVECMNQAEQLAARHQTNPTSLNGMLKVPYAVSSTLNCAGTIQVTKNGLAQCTVHAQVDLLSEGVCRGGILSADRHVSLRECGSKRGGRTIVKTKAEGSIIIGIAHPGTILVVGDQFHQLTETCIGIRGSLQNGRLTIR